MKRSVFLLLFMFVACTKLAAQTTSQKQEMIVEEMAYYFDDANIFTSVVRSNGRIILAKNDSVATEMGKTLIRCMKERWGCNFSSEQLEVKETSMWVDYSKFKTKLKKPQPGKWHLYLLVLDNIESPFVKSAFQSADNGLGNTAPYKLKFRCKVLNGTDESEVFSKDLTVELVTEKAPAGQFQLKKMPVLPASFMAAFDSTAAIFFSTKPADYVQLPVKPACIFEGEKIAAQNERALLFENKGDTIRQLIGKEFTWVVGTTKTERTGKVSNLGSNTLSGALTMFTGIGTTKTKRQKYLATIEMTTVEGSEKYQFSIPFQEEESMDRTREKTRHSDGSKSYSVNKTGAGSIKRYMDSENSSYLLLNADTIGQFNIRLGEHENWVDKYTQCWDGFDSSTVIPMPQSWNNQKDFTPVNARGTIFGAPFYLQNAKDGNQLDVYYKDQHLASLQIENDRPQRGVLLMEVEDPKIMKAFAMLCSLPLSYFQFFRSYDSQ